MNYKIIIVVLLLIIIYLYFNKNFKVNNKKSLKISVKNFNPAIHHPAAL
jgi:uncharacterized membrane protein YvbJ